MAMRPLKPAPEPKPVATFELPAPGTAARPDRGAIEELVKETADLGFSRESHAAPQAPQEPAPEPKPEAPAPPPPSPPAATAKRASKKAAPAPAEPAPNWSIKFDADNTLYMELLMESRRRRVSMKFLVLQILKDQGYTVDLDKAAEDGRRNR